MAVAVLFSGGDLTMILTSRITSEQAESRKAARHSDFVRMDSGSLESTSQVTFISHELSGRLHFMVLTVRWRAISLE